MFKFIKNLFKEKLPEPSYSVVPLGSKYLVRQRPKSFSSLTSFVTTSGTETFSTPEYIRKYCVFEDRDHAQTVCDEWNVFADGLQNAK